MKTIIASVTSNLETDQRVQKMGTTLVQDSYDVLIIGRNYKNISLSKTPYNVLRLSLLFNKGFLFYTEFSFRLFITLIRKANRKSILVSNDLDTLLPNYLVSKIYSCPLVFDSHELFSELPYVQGKFSQKVWRFLEVFLITKTTKVFTVSDSIANWYQKKYNVTATVIKNYPFKKKQSLIENTSEKYILYQGAINKGRGLIQLVKSLIYLPSNIHLKIAGDGPFKNELITAIKKENLENRVKVLGQILPENLYSITQNALVGVSVEENLGLSYEFALPNKLFDYIQARIPIVGSNLPEIKHIIEQYQVGEVIQEHTPEAIANAISIVLNKEKSYYQKKLEFAAEELRWEHQEATILSQFNSIKST